MDILLYLLGGASCQSIASVGGLSVFRREHYDPDTMAPMCVDCPQKDACAYSAPRLYGSGKIRSVVFDLSSVDNVRESLATRPMAAACMPATTTWRDHQATAILL